MYCSNHLPTLPLWGEIRPTVVNSCLDLSYGWISFYLFYLLCLLVSGGAGEDIRELFGADGPSYCVLVDELGGVGEGGFQSLLREVV